MQKQIYFFNEKIILFSWFKKQQKQKLEQIKETKKEQLIKRRW